MSNGAGTLPKTDARFSIRTVVSTAVTSMGRIVGITFGARWEPNCQVTPNSNDANAMANVGVELYGTQLFLLALTGGLPVGTYTWNVSCAI